MNNFVCIPPSSRIALTVAMETMHCFKVHLSLSLWTKHFLHFYDPNDLAPMKNCPRGASN